MDITVKNGISENIYMHENCGIAERDSCQKRLMNTPSLNLSWYRSFKVVCLDCHFPYGIQSKFAKWHGLFTTLYLRYTLHRQRIMKYIAIVHFFFYFKNTLNNLFTSGVCNIGNRNSCIFYWTDFSADIETQMRSFHTSNQSSIQKLSQEKCSIKTQFMY